VILGDAADETLYRRSWLPYQSTPSTRRCSDDETVVGQEEFKHDDEESDFASEMPDYSIDGLNWLEDKGDLDLRLDDYHQAIADTNRRTMSLSGYSKRRSRRTPSLSSLSIRRGRSSTSSSRPQIEIPPTPALPARLPHSRSSSFSVKHLRSQASVSSIDPRATHYQDPTARMKLRVYLASPQKFDEAVEFGFPSVQGRTPWTPVRPMTSPQPRPDANRTFFYDDTPELSCDDDEDEAENFLDPRTPEDPVFHMNRSPRKASMDGLGVSKLRPFSSRRPEPYSRGLSSDREMTLHMTLTRPDLRSREEARMHHDHQNVNLTPLEKAELPLESNAISIWDELPAEESRIKRLLRKLKLK
jgi:hypothetical protein